MVKNVRPSTSASHLYLRNTTAVTAPDSKLRESINALKAELKSLGVTVEQEDGPRAGECVPRTQQNADPSDTQSVSKDSSHMDSNAIASPLLTVEKPSPPDRLPGHWISAARSSWEEAPSSAELGMQKHDSNLRSLFDGYVKEGLSTGREPLEETMNNIENSLYQRYKKDELDRRRALERDISYTDKLEKEKAFNQFGLKGPEAYTRPFCEFLTENPTVFHVVQYFESRLEKAGFEKLYEREEWNDAITAGGKYFVTRNGSSVIAFTVGAKYRSGNGVAMIAGHIDALTAKVKPVSNKKTTAGYVQLGVAPFAGALNSTWWDRDLGVGGRVLVKDAETKSVLTKLVKLDWPIARIPTLAPHFGVGMTGGQNKETEAVPIIGLDNSDMSQEEFKNFTLGGSGPFTSTQPPKLVRAIASELDITDYSTILNWELELFDTQPAQTGGMEKEFIFGGRIDDKLCSWAAMEALLADSTRGEADDDSIIKLVSLFDDEEIGSLLSQGARGNFLPATIERVVETLTPGYSKDTLFRTYANSFLISADVTHAVNPNFVGSYLENHAPRLNVGLVVSADSNGHMTTNPVSTALLTQIAEKNDDVLQIFMIRNDSRSGGTVGPMLSSAMGVRAIDAGIPQLSMHSIRATTGSLDPGLGVKVFAGFFEHFETVDKEFVRTI